MQSPRVSIEQVFRRFKRYMKMNDISTLIPDLVDSVFEGLKHLDMRGTFPIREYEFENEGTYSNKYIEAPNDFWSYERVFMNGVEIFPAMHNIKSKMCFGEFIQEGEIFWLPDVPQTFGLVYRAIETDDQGLPMVKEHYVDALAMQCVEDQTFGDYLSGKISKYVYDDVRQKSELAFRRARGAETMPSPELQRQINTWWNNWAYRKYDPNGNNLDHMVGVLCSSLSGGTL